MLYIFAVVGAVVIIDIYLRLRNHLLLTRFLLLMKDVANTALVNKGILSKNDIDAAREEVKGKMNVGDYVKLKRDILKLLKVDIDT